MGVKLLISVAIYQASPSWWVGLIGCLVFFMGYRYIIASICGYNVMDVMDLNCFSTNDKAPCNVMSATPVSKGRTDLTKECFTKLPTSHLKGRSRIVKVLGDFYYQELKIEDVIDSNIEFLPDGTLNSREDV